MISTYLLIIIIALLASAFFSGVEVAFASANHLKIELDKQKGMLSGKILSGFVKNDSNFIASLLLGNNIALVIYSIGMANVLELLVAPLIGDNNVLILIVQIVLATTVIIVTVGFLPKATFQINPNRMLHLFSIPIFIVYYLLYPLTICTVFIMSGVFKIFGMNIKNGVTAFTQIDLDNYVRDLSERMEEESELDNEMQILQNALGFSETKARDTMVPRTDTVALEIDSSIEELKNKFIETGLSKILIYRGNMDNIVGYVHSFELFKKPKRINEVLIPVAFVPEATLSKNLLELFAKQHGNIAVVVDEFGGTSGIITLEDVVEEIFGEIEDEHDVDALIEQQINENTFLFSARQEIDHVNEKYNLDLEKSSEYETIGGLIIHHIESIPETGTVLVLDNYKIKIEEVTDRRIELVKIEVEL